MKEAGFLGLKEDLRNKKLDNQGIVFFPLGFKETNSPFTEVILVNYLISQHNKMGQFH